MIQLKLERLRKYYFPTCFSHNNNEKLHNLQLNFLPAMYICTYNSRTGHLGHLLAPGSPLEP